MTLLLLLLACKTSTEGDWALSMNGIPACAEFPVSAALTAPATLELWFKADPSEFVSPLVSWTGLYGLSIDTDGYLSFTLGGTGQVMSGAPVTDGQLHHVAGVFSGEKAYMYVDGQKAGFDDASLDNQAGTVLRLGCDGEDSLSGMLEEVRLSTVARYEDDFEPVVGNFESDADTWALFHFDEGSGTETVEAVSGDSALLTEVEWVASPFGS